MYNNFEYTDNLAQQHALLAQKHGETVERCGKFLQQFDDYMTQKHGQFIQI